MKPEEMGRLVLSLPKNGGEMVTIGDGVTIRVKRASNPQQIKLVIDAPKKILVRREVDNAWVKNKGEENATF